MHAALWGEMLAQKLNCRHFAFMMQESFHYYQKEKLFIRFNLDRHEVAGISKSSVNKMLGDDSLPFNESMHIRALYTNTIDDCEDTISQKLDPSADVSVCTIGRLEKPYVLPMMQQLHIWFAEHVQKKFNFVVVGGTTDDSLYKKIQAIFSKDPNVNLIFTGYTFPIPKSLVDKCDVIVSASGSAQAAYNQKRPTIRVNPIMADIIGIVGLT